MDTGERGDGDVGAARGGGGTDSGGGSDSTAAAGGGGENRGLDAMGVTLTDPVDTMGGGGGGSC